MNCKHCGGSIHRRPNVAYSDKNQHLAPNPRPWLHLRPEDWEDDPHNAEPEKDNDDAKD